MKAYFLKNKLLAFCVAFSAMGVPSHAVVSANESSQKNYHVAITQIVQHPSLDLIRKGITDELTAQGFVVGDNLRISYDDAQGNISIAAQIAQKFVSSAPDVLVGIATPSAQTLLSAVRDRPIPLVFGAVTNPLSAKLVTSLEAPGGNVTGTTDLPPIAQQIALIRQLFPQATHIGVLYNPGEANNAYQVKIIKQEAKKVGLEVLEGTIYKTADLSAVTRSLATKVSAFLLPNDNSVISALESVLQVARENQVPVFTSDPESVARGATAAVANDQYQVGRATGGLVSRILKGEKAGDIPVYTQHTSQLYVNEAAFKALGLMVPKKAMDGADKR